MTDNNRDTVSIPYFVHEGMMTRWERNFRLVLVMLIITVVLLFATNAMWTYYWHQFDIVTEEITMEADDGDANYIGNDGEINYGTGDSKTTQKNET